MKTTFIASMMVLLAGSTYAQNNVSLYPPNGTTVCHNMGITVHVNGNAFTPVNYLWSNGATTSSINITSSGTYTLTVQGYLGGSNKLVTRIRTATYNVLSAPTIDELTPLWVCKGDTVELAATPGYDTYAWNTGETGSQYVSPMNNPGTPGTPALDTLSVYYTASISGLCSVSSDPVMLRSIRRPNGVGRAYQGRMDIPISDSIPAGLVLEYLYPVSYVMEFTDLSDPNNQVEWLCLPGSRKAPANILEQGKSYSVESTPVINGVIYCPGPASTIGIAATTPRLAFGMNAEEEGLKTYRIYDVNGRLLIEKQSDEFNKEWLDHITPQMLIIHKTGITTEITKMQLVR